MLQNPTTTPSTRKLLPLVAFQLHEVRYSMEFPFMKKVNAVLEARLIFNELSRLH